MQLRLKYILSEKQLLQVLSVPTYSPYFTRYMCKIMSISITFHTLYLNVTKHYYNDHIQAFFSKFNLFFFCLLMHFLFIRIYKLLNIQVSLLKFEISHRNCYILGHCIYYKTGNLRCFVRKIITKSW